MIVADTNLILYLLVPGDLSEQAEAVLEQDPDWLAPLLWRSELRNALATYVRSGALELREAIEIVADAEALMNGREALVASPSVLRLSAGSGCSAYDCEFVALAEEEGLPLVTSDRRVRSAFPGIAISPEEFTHAR